MLERVKGKHLRPRKGELFLVQGNSRTKYMPTRVRERRSRRDLLEDIKEWSEASLKDRNRGKEFHLRVKWPKCKNGRCLSVCAERTFKV